MKDYKLKCKINKFQEAWINKWNEWKKNNVLHICEFNTKGNNNDRSKWKRYNHVELMNVYTCVSPGDCVDKSWQYPWHVFQGFLVAACTASFLGWLAQDPPAGFMPKVELELMVSHCLAWCLNTLYQIGSLLSWLIHPRKWRCRFKNYNACQKVSTDIFKLCIGIQNRSVIIACK